MASIFIRTLLIYIFLSISLKIMGKRQISELEINELVSTLVVSEVAALPIADPDIPLFNALVPIILIVCLEIIISSLKNKSEKIKRYVEGEPSFIIYKGKLNQRVLMQNRVSINELLCEMRTQGIGDINEIFYAILEPNGKLSVFNKIKSKNFNHIIIVDTKTNENVMQLLGYGKPWLQKQLEIHKVSQDNVFLMTVDDSGKTYIIKKDDKNESS